MMARKKETQPKTSPNKPPGPKAGTSSRRLALQVVLLILLVVAFLAGLIILGKWGQEQIRGHDRYALSFADIECTPPPGLSRSEFLDEVLYLSRLPNRFGILDDDLSGNITRAFEKHPWVEKVDGVILQPPKHIQVNLIIRKPVLAVPTKDGIIAVDRLGVRLPKNAVTAGLPLFEGEVLPPKGEAGTKWGDPKVEERAKTIAGIK